METNFISAENLDQYVNRNIKPRDSITNQDNFLEIVKIVMETNEKFQRLMEAGRLISADGSIDGENFNLIKKEVTRIFQQKKGKGISFMETEDLEEAIANYICS
ncbi:MAG: hypothetical protein PHF46_02605 [Candidatus Gracilibacteria bacterium]|nr:hypothetical protein [Candidatus Gracilibacteria bacterium]MDD3120273.1 hypothetical protein [Candidatus Gracilibacteria bacterium]